MSAYAFGSFGEETVAQARVRACRRIAWTAGVTAGVLLLALQAAAFLAVLHAGLSSREALLAGCVPLGGPVYGGVLLALRSSILWAPLALLLLPVLAAVVVSVVYGVSARRARRDDEEEALDAETEAEIDDLLPPSAIVPAPLRPAASPQPASSVETTAPATQQAREPETPPVKPEAPAAPPIAPVPMRPSAPTAAKPAQSPPAASPAPAAEITDPALRQAQEEYEAARARIADILKQK